MVHGKEGIRIHIEFASKKLFGHHDTTLCKENLQFSCTILRWILVFGALVAGACYI